MSHTNAHPPNPEPSPSPPRAPAPPQPSDSGAQRANGQAARHPQNDSGSEDEAGYGHGV
jgi:hypothetical protein